MNIIIDGPEKAGKTTTIKELAKRIGRSHDVEVLKWGPVKPDDRVYSGMLQTYASTRDAVAIWDRGWPSEYVYGKLLRRKDHRMTDDPWLGAWLHDRAVQANGIRVMLLGPSAEEMYALRDGSDLQVDPENEVQLYEEYAKRFGWFVYKGFRHDKEGLSLVVDSIMEKFVHAFPTQTQPLPPSWSGPQDATVVIVGNTLSEKTIPGGWLPFTSRMTTMFGRIFGDDAIKYAWTNVRDCSPAYLRNRKVIIACGNVAHTWIRNYVYDKENEYQKIAYVPHPSYLFRFKNDKTEQEIKRTVEELKSLVEGDKDGR